MGIRKAQSSFIHDSRYGKIQSCGDDGVACFSIHSATDKERGSASVFEVAVLTNFLAFFIDLNFS